MTEDDKSIPLSNVVKIDDERLRGHLDRIVRGTVEDTLNALLDAEADRMCNAQRYQRSDERRDTRAGHDERKLHTKAGEGTSDQAAVMSSQRRAVGFWRLRWCLSAALSRLSVPAACVWSKSGARQVSSRQIEVGKGKQREHLRTVLGDAAVARFAIPELALSSAVGN